MYTAIKKNTQVIVLPTGGTPVSSRSTRKSGSRRSRRGNGNRNLPGITRVTGRGPIQPAGTRTVYNAPAPPGDAAGAWIKSMLDPAHAREHHCRGIPDENRDPTIIANGRCDGTIGSTNLWNVKNEYIAAGWYYVTGWDKMADPKVGIDAQVHNFTVYTCGQWGTCIIYEGTFKHSESGASKTSSKVAMLYRSISFNFNMSEEANIRGARAIGVSHTLSNVTAWANKGGFFTAGHVPLTRYYEDVDDSIELATPVKVDEYATYNADSGAGVYGISRPRSIDMMKIFGEEDADSVVLGGQRLNMFPYLKYPAPAWDIVFTSYEPSSSDWRIRCTQYYVVEANADYSKGGSDGAAYDKSALEFALAILDREEFLFPANANDFKQVVRRVWETVKRWGASILRAMGIVGPADLAQRFFGAYLAPGAGGGPGRRARRNPVLADDAYVGMVNRYWA